MELDKDTITKHANVIKAFIDAAKLGSGARFAALKKKLGSKGASNPGALAAYIGRKKYGKKKFQGLAAKGNKGY